MDGEELVKESRSQVIGVGTLMATRNHEITDTQKQQRQWSNTAMNSPLEGQSLRNAGGVTAQGPTDCFVQ